MECAGSRTLISPSSVRPHTNVFRLGVNTIEDEINLLHLAVKFPKPSERPECQSGHNFSGAHGTVLVTVLRTQLAGSSVSFTNSACWFLCFLYFEILSVTFFFDSALRTNTVRFIGLTLVRLAAVQLLGDRFGLAL